MLPVSPDLPTDRRTATSPRSHAPTPDDLADILDDIIGATEGQDDDGCCGLGAFGSPQGDHLKSNDKDCETSLVPDPRGCSASSTSTAENGLHYWLQRPEPQASTADTGETTHAASITEASRANRHCVSDLEHQEGATSNCTEQYWEQHQRMKTAYLPTLVALYQSLARVSGEDNTRSSLHRRSGFLLTRLKPIIKRLNISRDDSPQVARATFTESHVKRLLDLESRISLYLVILKHAKKTGTSSPVSTSPTKVGITSPLRNLDLSLQMSPTGRSPVSSPLRQPRFFTLSSPNGPTSPRPQSNLLDQGPGQSRSATTAPLPFSDSAWPTAHKIGTANDTSATDTAAAAASSHPQPGALAPAAPHEESTDIQAILRSLSSGSYDELGP